MSESKHNNVYETFAKSIVIINYDIVDLGFRGQNKIDDFQKLCLKSQFFFAFYLSAHLCEIVDSDLHDEINKNIICLLCKIAPLLNSMTKYEWQLNYKLKLNQNLNQLLESACRENNLNAMRIYIANGADIHQQYSKNKMPLLSIAIQHNLIDAATELLKCGADINSIDKNGKTALMYAILQKNKNPTSMIKMIKMTKTVKMLLTNNINVNLTDVQGLTALMFAIKKNKFDQFVTLLKHDADVNVTSKMGTTALIEAALHNNKKMILELLAYDADVNIAFQWLKKYNKLNAIKMLELALIEYTNTNQKYQTLQFRQCQV